MSERRRFGLLFLSLFLFQSPASSLAQAVGTYPLDDMPRVLPVGAPLNCNVPLTTFRGEQVRYRTPAHVYVGFASHLQAFETVLVEHAIKAYGRAPRLLIHMGTQSCRRMRRYPEWVSEHALANGIDVAGFDFGPLPKGTAGPVDMPRALRGGFSVRVDKHWHARGATGEWHSRFLHALTTALMGRQDIFRVMLGPGFPGHKNHFHFDYAPYRVVDGFDQTP